MYASFLISLLDLETNPVFLHFLKLYGIKRGDHLSKISKAHRVFNFHSMNQAREKGPLLESHTTVMSIGYVL